MAVELPISGIQAFNGIGGVNDLPDIRGKLENRGDGIPVRHPPLHRTRVFCRLFFGHAFKVLQSFLLIRRIIYGFKISCERLPFFLRYIFQGVAYLVDDAALVLGLGIGTVNGFFYAGKAVGTDEQYVIDATVL